VSAAISGPAGGLLRAVALSPQQLRQFGDVSGDALGLVAGEEVRRRPASRLLPEVHVGERLPGIDLIDRPWGREAALEQVSGGAEPLTEGAIP
jgi:hypothetical protein